MFLSNFERIKKNCLENFSIFFNELYVIVFQNLKLIFLIFRDVVFAVYYENIVTNI
jgi:hypothetical protein